MKKRIVLLAILTLVLSGCGARSDYPENVGRPLVTEVPTVESIAPETTELVPTETTTPETTAPTLTETDASNTTEMPTQEEKEADDVLRIQVESIQPTAQGMRIVLYTENETGNVVSMGLWSTCFIEVTTTEDTYYHELFMIEIPRGKGQLSFDVKDAKGEVRKIVITELCLHNSDGFQASEIHNAVVYDVENSIDGFSREPNVFFNENNYYYEENKVSVRPRYVYWEDGVLVAECFVVNGFSETVSQLEVERLAFGNEEGVFADGRFGLMDGAVIQPYSYIIWTFSFHGDSIQVPNADLSYLKYESGVSFKH